MISSKTPDHLDSLQNSDQLKNHERLRNGCLMTPSLLRFLYHQTSVIGVYFIRVGLDFFVSSNNIAHEMLLQGYLSVRPDVNLSSLPHTSVDGGYMTLNDQSARGQKAFILEDHSMSINSHAGNPFQKNHQARHLTLKSLQSLAVEAGLKQFIAYDQEENDSLLKKYQVPDEY